MSVQFFSDTPIPKRLAIQNFAKKIRANLSKRRTAEEIYVVFVSDNEIRKLNRVFLKHDRPTDVIAFNYTPAKKNLPFGDIYVSLDTARRQAHRQKYPSEQEISLLVLHGLLHLFGYEDHTAKEKQKMFTKQKQLFRTIAPKLAPPDFR